MKEHVTYHDQGLRIFSFSPPFPPSLFLPLPSPNRVPPYLSSMSLYFHHITVWVLAWTNTPYKPCSLIDLLPANGVRGPSKQKDKEFLCILNCHPRIPLSLFRIQIRLLLPRCSWFLKHHCYSLPSMKPECILPLFAKYRTWRGGCRKKIY